MTTLLNDLPDKFQDNIQVKPNVSFDIKENDKTIQLDQTTINQIINGLQNASGSTKLPSRDIPNNKTEHLINDIKTIPDHIEIEDSIKNISGKNKKEYIEEHLNKDDLINNYNNKINNNNKIDIMYDELNGPILVAVLYFIFQLPFFKKMLIKNIPLLINEDFNYNIYGYIFISIFFSMIFYFLNFGLKQFDKF